LLNPHL